MNETYGSFTCIIVLGAGQTKAITGTVLKTHMTEREELKKLASLWIWLQVHFSFPGKHQADEQTFEKRKLQTLMV